MTGHENLQAMRSVAGELLDDFLVFFDQHLAWDGEECWLPYGSFPQTDKLPVDPKEPPSSRLSCDLALGYLANVVEREAQTAKTTAATRTTTPPATAGGYLTTTATANSDDRRLRAAYGLLRHAFRRQHPRGWFVWNYGQFEIDQVDLGTVLDTYYYFWTLLGDRLPEDIRAGLVDSTRRAMDYLRTAEQPDYPGIIQKRAADPDHPESRRTANYQNIDVINGNALAITAACRAAVILGDASLVGWASRFQRNLLQSFGRHVSGWWAYVERLGTREMLGPQSILYQAMTALYLEPLYRARPNPELGDVLARSMQTVAATLDAGGEFDWSHESRETFVDTQLLMLPSATAALADVGDVTDAGRRRLERVARTMYDRREHLFHDAVGRRRQGEAGHELMQIWAASDLALIMLFARRAAHGVSAR